MRALTLLLVSSLAACVPDVDRRGRNEPDAPMIASSVDAGCASPGTFYTDSDGDGHGDPSSLVTACEQPAGTVETNDDCNDASADIHPGATDACDGVDNDCNAATAEACPAGCAAVARDQRVYLFCGNPINWPNARAACLAAGMRLVEIDDAAENTFVRDEATNRFGGVEIHIGATDGAQENTWQWDGGDVFWVGNQNGAPANNRFAAWQTGEPNGSDDCAEMRADARWYDNGCGDNQRYVCRK